MKLNLTKKEFVAITLSFLLFIGISAVAHNILQPMFERESLVNAAPTTGTPVGTIQAPALFNSTAANTNTNQIDTITIAGGTNQNVHIYHVSAACDNQALIGQLKITDNGAAIWKSNGGGGVSTTYFVQTWSPALTVSTGNSAVITRAACGSGVTGSLNVQADRW